MKLAGFAASIAVFALMGFCFAEPLAVGSSEFWNFEQKAPFPVQLEGAISGLDGDRMLVLGGYKTDSGKQKPNLDIYVFSPPENQWQILGRLEKPIRGAATVNTSQGLVSIGGVYDGKISKSVIRYTVSGANIVAENLPELPFEVSSPKAAFVSGRIYLAGYSDQAKPDGKVFLRLDMLARAPNWQSIEPWQGQARVGMNVAAVADKLYLFGGKTPDTENLIGSHLYDAYEYTSNSGWAKLVDIPFTATNAFAAACGEAHIIFLGVEESPNDLFAYHAITRMYLKFDGLKHTSTPMALVSVGTRIYAVGSDEMTVCDAILPGTKYGWADHSVVVVFMIAMLCVGGYLAKKEKSNEDYFRGGRSVPWWATGLSMFATGASAISLMAMPGKAFATNWLYMSPLFFLFFTQLPLSIYVYMPIARRLRVSTANEYLERRFNLFMRLLASVIWSALQILGRMSAIMLLPAIALSSIAGMSIEASILIMGVITTVYVFLGGLEGVIWTDVLQAFVMIIAVGICASWALFSLDMGAREAFTQIQSADKLHMFDTHFDITRGTFFIILISTVMSTLGQIGDQNYIQRVQCTKSEKEAKKAIITQLAVAVPLNIILFSLGTILFLFYLERPETLSPATKSDGVFPLFAAQNLPSGLAGLVVAAILAATMSTLSSALNSTANIGVEDFYRRIFKNATDKKCLIIGKILTAGLGVFGTGAALVLANTKLISIWDLFITIFGMLMGAVAGVFILGIFTKRANSAGAIIGAIASLAATFYMQRYTHIHFFMYPVFGILSCLFVGYIASVIIPLPKKDLAGLTAYTLGKCVEQDG